MSYRYYLMFRLMLVLFFPSRIFKFVLIICAWYVHYIVSQQKIHWCKRWAPKIGAHKQQRAFKVTKHEMVACSWRHFLTSHWFPKWDRVYNILVLYFFQNANVYNTTGSEPLNWKSPIIPALSGLFLSRANC